LHLARLRPQRAAVRTHCLSAGHDALCVESFIGAEGGKEGVKLEEQVLITEAGAERLSSYPMEEDWI
jgi:hypothetical protein